MKKFSKKVDLRSRKAMAQYLSNHFRYNTAGGWNNSTSYANNVKLYNLGLSSEQVDKLYDLLDCEGIFGEINDMLCDFGMNHDYTWQAGFNGRSGGYLVLYQGGKKASEWKSYCTSCGQRNYRSTSENGCRCGKCGRETRKDYQKPPMQTFAYPMRGTDMDEDFEDWSMEALRERVKLVQEFDRLADDIAEHAAYMAENYTVEEEEYFVPATRKVAVAM